MATTNHQRPRECNSSVKYRLPKSSSHICHHPDNSELASETSSVPHNHCNSHNMASRLPNSCQRLIFLSLAILAIWALHHQLGSLPTVLAQASGPRAPYFINQPTPLQAIVPTKATSGTFIYKLRARSPETKHDSNIRYILALDKSGGRFEVDERTGEVRTRGNEHFILDKNYEIFVRAEDHTRSAKLDNFGRTLVQNYPSSPEIRLSIIGGRRPPQFLTEKYSISIREDTKKETEILDVKAKSFADRAILYTLTSKGRALEKFTIDPNRGRIILAKEIDFERDPQTYTLRVNASEDAGGFTSTTDVTVSIIDVNDNAPRFELPDYQVHGVLEDVKIGTVIKQITATDADSGVNAEIDYSIDRPEFSIDSRGNIITSRRLDADVNQTYILTVKATDRGSPPLSGTAVVRITTENTNDEAPKFSQDVYTPNVDENAGPRTLVTTVVASDRDGDNVVFGFASPKNPLFHIDERTGVIRLSEKVVKLDTDKYELNVTAKDDGKCCDRGNNIIHTSTALVVVFITDVNDQKPTFEDCSNYNPTVKENSPFLTPVTTVKATDNDKGHNGQVRYSIVQQHNQKGTKFVIDEITGEIKTNKVFDREGEDGRFVSVTVKAVDRGTPPLEGVCSFKVEITDVNDNPPLFDRQEYHENIRQDMAIGSHILRVSASDEDVDLNGAISYHLSSNQRREDLDYFGISQETGWISLKRALDKDTYSFRALARDQSPPFHNASVDVVLDVVDRSNSPPQWDQPVYTRRVKENAQISSTIITIKASSGMKDNNNVFYTMIRGSTEQTNKLTTFFLTTRNEGLHVMADIQLNYPLDYERITYYNLTIRAENDGVQQLASECSLNIEVEDVNDEIPLFVEREQQTVLESMPPGTRVTQVQAIDKDGTSPNNVVYYQIESQDGADKNFTIDRNTGEIFTKVEFDREEKQNYALVIRAIDGAPSARPGFGGAPNSVTTKIRIGIGDKNDNSPYFDSSLYEAEVNEDEDSNHVLITVNAKDKDESSKLRYEIVKGNIGGGAFAVNAETGAIYVAGPLDYELRKEYKLVLVASDNLNENYTNVIIKVKDVNDNPPIFDRPTYQTTITEGDDKRLPKKILQYNLSLTVSDTLLESTTMIRIKVRDVNDLPPKFSQNAYVVTIEEELPERKKILQVSATDGDRDRPQKIVYYIHDQGNVDKNEKFFSINQQTGEIFVEKPLDRDAPNGRPVWRFTVYAEDEGGVNGLVGYADVVVNLKDVNDNTPFFPNTAYYGNVSERGLPDTPVMTMQAIDYDDLNEGRNAKLTYAISQNQLNENNELIFRIDEDTGVIYTAVGNLDRETNPEYTLKITATDGGGHEGYAQAVIRVKDVNDMPPTFAKKDWYVEVDETLDNKIPETPILIVQVNDADSLESNRFTYRVLEGAYADKFTMVTNTDGTGSLKIAKPLDYEDPEQKYGFNITIEVNDGGDIPSVPHTDTAVVKIRLRDINDNPPHFDRTYVETSVVESAPVRTILGEFRATDPDQNGRSKVRYSIDRSSNKRKQFVINPETGVLAVQRPLDREEQPRMSIKILATDDGIPQRSASATLMLTLVDVNDNPPKFLKDYVAVVYEGTPPGAIEDIQAADLDDRNSGNGPPFTFMMDPNAPQNIKDKFAVINDANVGDGIAHVLTKQVLDREQQKEYQIPIVITDSGRPVSLSGTSYLTVVVGDVNDNKMYPGTKTIFVYNYKGQYRNIPIGRVHVEDLDDWDLIDKRFAWENNMPHPNFHLDSSNGTIFMKNVNEGSYLLKFFVSDKKYTQDVSANVTVVVKNLPDEAVYNSGSIRLSGITDEDFIRVWDWRTQTQVKSKFDHLREILSNILKEDTTNIDIFSVITHYKGRVPYTDVRFAAHGSPYHKSTFLNGYVAINRRAIEKELQLNITMVGIDECLVEFNSCDGSCSNTLRVEPYPHVVNANRTSLVGVYTRVVAECECAARQLDEIDGCNSQPPFCLNQGKCTMQNRLGTCECPPGYSGPQCQVAARTFGGHGWAWFPPLEQCESSHLSLEFMTESASGILFYNGPVDAPEPGVSIYQDFISLELMDGRPKLLVDFGSGTSEVIVNTMQELNDGDWHHVDIFWTREDIRMVIDYCRDAKFDEDSERPTNNRSMCEQKAAIKPFSEFLNVNSPLQIGGVFHREIEKFFRWTHKHTREGFKGCIKNFVHNSRMYDLGAPGGSIDSASGCSISEERCQSNSLASMCVNGQCLGNYKTATCVCDPGYMGPSCEQDTQVKNFQQSGFLRYALSFDPNPYITDIQLRFRTRQKTAELIRILGKNTREYCILEIRDKRLRFRYHLNQIHSTKEFELTLPEYIVNDGVWHTVRVVRHGSTATIEADGGGGRKSNEITDYMDQHQLLVVSKQGIVVGGDVSHIGPANYYVDNGLLDSCVTDIRIDQRHLPMENGSENAAVTESRNLIDGCISTDSCAKATNTCAPPFVCNDLWNLHECNCPTGWTTTEEGSCTDDNECSSEPCNNGGSCINLDNGQGFLCVCQPGYTGDICHLPVQEKMILVASSAYWVIAFVFINVIGLEKKETIPPTCGDRDECWHLSCGSSGICHNIDYGGGFYCECPFANDEFKMCTNCTCDNLLIDSQSVLQISSRAIFYIFLVCMLMSLLVVALFFMMRRGSMDQKYGTGDPDDDVRENIISYDDEGGGEDDMHAFDITPLRIPIDSSGTMISNKQNIFSKPGLLKDLRKGTAYDGDGGTYGMGDVTRGGQFIDPGLRLIEGDDRDAASRALDDLRNYAYEGCGSTAGSLSSLASIGKNDDETQDFDYLGQWGPRFQNLANLYSHNDVNERQQNLEQ